MRFQELIGEDLQNRKNQYEKSPNYQPLTPQTKIKVTFGSHCSNLDRPFPLVVLSFHAACLLTDEHVPLKLMN